MPESKLFIFLDSLSRKDWRRLDTYLRSGLEPVLPRELAAWESISSAMLAKTRPSQADRNALREQLELLERRIRSALLGHAMGFLRYEQWALSPESQHLDLVRALNARELDELLPGALAKAESILPDVVGGSSPYGLSLLAEQLKFQARQPQRLPSSLLPAIHRRLDAWFMLQKLKYTCAELNQGKIFHSSISADTDWFPLIEAHLNASKPDSQLDALIRLYFLAAQTLRDGNEPATKEAALRQLLDALGKRSANFAQEDVADLYTYSLNYCIRMINRQSSPAHVQLIRRIYEGLLESGAILSPEGLLSPLHLKNIVATFIRLKAFDAAEEFIARYANRLEKDEKGVGRQYGEGLLHFYQGRLDRAYHFFDVVIGESDDVFFGLDSRAFQIQVIFQRRTQDPEWFSALENHARAFKRVLERRKSSISPIHLANYQGFIKASLALARIATSPPGSPRQGQMDSLAAQIRSAMPMADKVWLNAMLKELKEGGREGRV